MDFLHETLRLRLFISEPFKISEYWAADRMQVVAYPTHNGDVHTPMPVVTALLLELPDLKPIGCDLRIDWLEVASQYRRQGFATEVLDVLVEHFPDLKYSAGTEDGEAFLQFYEQRQVRNAQTCAKRKKKMAHRSNDLKPKKKAPRERG